MRVTAFSWSSKDIYDCDGALGVGLLVDEAAGALGPRAGGGLGFALGPLAGGALGPRGGPLGGTGGPLTPDFIIIEPPGSLPVTVCLMVS